MPDLEHRLVFWAVTLSMLGEEVLFREIRDPNLSAVELCNDFLMPESAIAPYLSKLTLAKLRALKLDWGVPMVDFIRRTGFAD